MLELVRSFVGCPASDVHILSLPKEILLAYAFADCVVLVNAQTFSFTRALAFWEVFPGTRDIGQHVKCISIEPGMRLIAASSGPHIACWSLSGVQKDTWRVHSSLTVSDGQPVTALDCKSGLLGVANESGLSVYTLDLEDELLIWTRKWFISTGPYSVVRFSPSLMHLATISPNEKVVRIYSTASGNLLQKLRHPRPVQDFIWRFSKKSSRDDLILFTITTDATLRIFLPVLDTPHFLQFHAALDTFCEESPIMHKQTLSKKSSIFWLHKDTLTDSFASALSSGLGNSSQLRKIKEMSDEGWDFFLRVFPDNSIIIRAVANIDRRPPTLLRHFTLLQSIPSTLSAYPEHLHILKVPTNSSLIIVTSPPLRTYSMDPTKFFHDGQSGMKLLAQGPDINESGSSKVIRYVRTPDGRGLGILREDAVESWQLCDKSCQLIRIGRLDGAKQVAVLDKGERVVLYTESEHSFVLSLYQPPFESQAATLDVPRLTSLFSLPPSKGFTMLIGITPNNSIVRIEVSNQATPMLKFLSETTVPTVKPPALIIPVDPMAWSYSKGARREQRHDVILTISETGELAFWAFDDDDQHKKWVCTGQVKTGRTGYRLARCSSAKKTALVIQDSGEEEMTIWDSKESEFASGLEYRTIFAEEPINDLDWTSTPGSQSVLAVGFSHYVLLLCQQRMTYFNDDPAWGTLRRIEIGHMITHRINDSIWLSNGNFLVGSGHHMLQYGQCPDKGAAERSSAGLFEHVARLNGPLPDYHPQMILQCLLWGKVELVKEIIENLARDLKKAGDRRGDSRSFSEWRSVPIDSFLKIEQTATTSKSTSRVQYSLLFDGPEVVDASEDEDRFSRALVEDVIKKLETEPIAHLTRIENAHLIVLLQTAIEIEEQRRSLDANGLRYLISMRSFYILNARATSPLPGTGSVSPTLTLSESGSQTKTFARERLRFRDMIWAFHSESQEILLAASASACGNKMKWNDAKALGIFLWMNSLESMKSQLETIARNEYLVDDARDPTTCSLFYFALGKVRLVYGLWKQASWHKEQSVMLKFLSNDFSQTRWKTAALKNAYALLARQRFEYAAAFFLLGGALKDAVNVCVRQLGDFQLAIAIARVAEQDEEKPVLKGILTSVVIPIAFEKGNRWLASWAFWQLHRRDLAVRILVSPLKSILASLDMSIEHIGDPNYDDPSLALLFSQLKSKSLQTAKGAYEISGATEFNFVLQTTRVFCRMGCHALALYLVRSWSFERPTAQPLHVNSSTSIQNGDMLGPLPERRPHVLGGHRRRSSIAIDMEVPSDPSTRPASPDNQDRATSLDSMRESENETSGAGKGLGSLLKSAKQDVKVPEFDMSAFSF